MADKSFRTDWEYPGLRECQIEKNVGTTVKCAICKSSEVVGICHHCGKLLCEQHIAKPKVHQDPSQEFAPMLGGRKWAEAVHCEEHAHFVFSALKTMVWPGGIVTASSFLFVFVGVVSILMFVMDLINNDLFYNIWMTWLVSTWMSADRGLVWDLLRSELGGFLLSLVIFLIGLGVFVYGLFLHFKKYLPQAKRVELGVIPVLPGQYVVRADEIVEIEIDVSKISKDYLRLVSHEGSVEMNISLDAGAQRSLEESQKKARKYGWLQTQLFDFGYVALDRTRWVQIAEQFSNLKSCENLHRLTCENVDISTLVDKGNWLKVLQWNYVIDDQSLRFRRRANLPERFVVWLKPTLLPMSAGRSVSFEFDLPKKIGTTATLKEFVLHIPKDAFDKSDVAFPIQQTNGQTYPNTFEIRWRNLRIGEDSVQWPLVTFWQDMTRMTAPMTAYFEIQIDTTLSGLQIEREYIWFPTGRPALRKGNTAIMQYRTLINGQATIDPTVFSYQYECTYTRVFQKDGIPLTHERIRKVLQALASKNVSIKNVLQREPVVELQEGAVQKRVWDILGRYYLQIYPVDVHVVIAGREPFNKEERVNSRMTIQLALRVLVNNKAAGMEQAIEGWCTRLGNILEKAVD